MSIKLRRQEECEQIRTMSDIVGFVAAAVSMPMGGCRARRSRVVVVVVSVTVESAEL